MSQALYVYYPVFQRTTAWAHRAAAEKQDAAQEVAALLQSPPGVTVRGIYATAGFRPDADLMFWWLSEDPDALQELLVAFRRTALGRELVLTWAFMGLSRPAEFAADHIPAFVRGDAPRKYLNVYPFVRTPEWYLIEPQERGRMLREHGGLGRDYGDVATNTTQAFGLGDYEWILAFEADRLDRIVDMIRTLRSAAARRYTKHELPFITGIKKDLTAAVADLD